MTSFADRAVQILIDLGLEKAANSVISSDSQGQDHRGISGGQRRRLSIAQALLGDPQAILLDEPTSGLDATSSLKLIKILHKMTRTRHSTIALTIHQPRSEVFNLFDNLILLGTGGCMIYSGPLSGATILLSQAKSIKLDISTYDNPGDFIMDVLGTNNGSSVDSDSNKSKFRKRWRNTVENIKDSSKSLLEISESVINISRKTIKSSIGRVTGIRKPSTCSESGNYELVRLDESVHNMSESNTTDINVSVTACSSDDQHEYKGHQNGVVSLEKESYLQSPMSTMRAYDHISVTRNYRSDSSDTLSSDVEGHVTLLSSQSILKHNNIDMTGISIVPKTTSDAVNKHIMDSSDNKDNEVILTDVKDVDIKRRKSVNTSSDNAELQQLFLSSHEYKVLYNKYIIPSRILPHSSLQSPIISKQFRNTNNFTAMPSVMGWSDISNEKITNDTLNQIIVNSEYSPTSTLDQIWILYSRRIQSLLPNFNESLFFIGQILGAGIVVAYTFSYQVSTQLELPYQVIYVYILLFFML